MTIYPRDVSAEPRLHLPPSPVEHLSSRKTQFALRTQEEILRAVRGFFHAREFVELLPPLIGPVTDPGIRGAKQIDVDYYGAQYKLMTSAILYKQAALQSFDRIFFIAPNVRLEPPVTALTNRHLVEFHQIDVEMREASREDVQQLAQDLLVYVFAHVLDTLSSEMVEAGRGFDVFTHLLSGQFDTFTHIEAVSRLRDLRHDQDPTSEIDWDGELLLSTTVNKPFFITDYPIGSRGFYDRESATSPGLLRNFDLFAHAGFGELASGAERESDYRKIIVRMRETGENPAKYGWYLDMARGGIPPSAGFGLGVERLTRYITGFDFVWQVSAFPKIPGVMSP